VKKKEKSKVKQGKKLFFHQTSQPVRMYVRKKERKKTERQKKEKK
jgi:hypothetical protein